MTSKIRKIRKRGPATLAIHGHERRPKAHHAVSTPICQTFCFASSTIGNISAMSALDAFVIVYPTGNS